MNYLAIDFTPAQYDSELLDILTALLSELPFESFEETETGLRGYMPEKKMTKRIDNQLVKLGERFGLELSRTVILHQNWNTVWESNFKPMVVRDFVGVRADFHPHTEGVKFNLVINPKMAFGTGHHETTYMVMQLMEGIDFVGKKVLDFGCGTGILAILASKMGAKDVEAVDIEEPSFENTIENCAINAVTNVKAIHGVLADVPAADFDVILANINRNIIIASLEDLKKKLVAKNGTLLTSGFLIQDKATMTAEIEKCGFKLEQTIERGNWLAMRLVG